MTNGSSIVYNGSWVSSGWGKHGMAAGDHTEFADSIAQERKPAASGEDNLFSLAMVIGAKYSAMSGETVSLDS